MFGYEFREKSMVRYLVATSFQTNEFLDDVDDIVWDGDLSLKYGYSIPKLPNRHYYGFQFFTKKYFREREGSWQTSIQVATSPLYIFGWSYTLDQLKASPVNDTTKQIAITQMEWNNVDRAILCLAGIIPQTDEHFVLQDDEWNRYA